MEIKNHNFANKVLSAWILAILTASFLFFYFYQPAIAPERHDKIFCTQEAKQCPDGSYVGRSGPNCEFVKCPISGGEKSEVGGEKGINTSNWKTYRNEKYRFEVKYPEWWFIQSEMSADYSVTMISSKPETENSHGVGYPSDGLWIEVAKNICNEPKNDFINIGPKPDIWEKVVCKSGFQISLGYWPFDGKRDNKIEEILNQTLSTFRFLK